MAKKIKSMLAGMLALVMLSTVALPALAEVDIPTTKTDWLGNGMQVNVKPGTDGYTYMIVADKDNGSVKKNFYYYETSNHTITKEVTGGGAVHLIPIVDTNKVSGVWTPDGIYNPGESNYDVVYCCDAVNGSEAGVYYKRINLEDSEYFSIEQAEKLRAILTQAYPYVSVDEAKEYLKSAGFEGAENLDRSELISATQAAIWSVANSDVGDTYLYNVTANTSRKLGWGGYMHDFTPEIKNFDLTSGFSNGYKKVTAVGERIDALKAFYLALEPVKAEAGQIVITKLDIVNSKIFGTEDKYNVALNVVLNQGADKDDKVVIKAYINGVVQEDTVTITEAKEYTLNLTASKGDNIKVVVSGTQNLEKGVYFYAPKPFDLDGDGIATSREVSQNLIGVAMGETPVHTEKNFSVDVVNVDLEINKVDTNGKALTGAKFALYDKNGNLVDSKEVDANGNLVFTNLIPGVYSLKETVAPAGYTLLAKPIEVIVNGDGSITYGGEKLEGDMITDTTVNQDGVDFVAPEVTVNVVTGSESTTVSKIEVSSDATKTVVGVRDVTVKMSEVKVTVGDIVYSNFKAPQSALKFDRSSTADQAAQKKIRDLYTDTGHFTDPSSVTVTDAPAGYPFKYIGTGDYSGHYVSHIRVIYDRNDDRTPKVDSEGKYIIKELQHANGTPLTYKGESTTSLTGPYDQTTGTRPLQFLLKDEAGNTVYGYCIDLETGANQGTWYAIGNLEDNDYYASEEAENHVRNIVYNGYWGTAEGQGSIASLKDALKKAVADGTIKKEYDVTFVIRGAKYTEGYVLQEDEYVGNGYICKHVTEHIVLTDDVIDGLTEGESLDAMQSAIWSFANGSNHSLDGTDRMIVGDLYYASSALGDGMNKQNDYAGAARTKALYEYLIGLDEDLTNTASTIINDKTFAENISLTVGRELAEGIYDASISFSLAAALGTEDDLEVVLTYVDANGVTQTIKAKLTGEGALASENGMYTLEGLTLKAGEEFNFSLNIKGSQKLEKGAYVFTSQGGIDKSQTMVTMAEFTTTVDVTKSASIMFEVDDYAEVTYKRYNHSVEVVNHKLDKTTEKLYENKYTDVTLEINGELNYSTGEKLPVDIIYILGGFLSADQVKTDTMINALKDTFSDLINKGVPVNFGIVPFSSTKDPVMELTSFTTEEELETLYDKVAEAIQTAGVVYDAVNMENALITAAEMFADSKLGKMDRTDRQHLVLVSSGHTYYFNGGENNEYISTVPVMFKKDTVDTNEIFYMEKAWMRARNNSTNSYPVPMAFVDLYNANPDMYDSLWDCYWTYIDQWAKADSAAGDTIVYNATTREAGDFVNWFNSGKYSSATGSDGKGGTFTYSGYGAVISNPDATQIDGILKFDLGYAGTNYGPNPFENEFAAHAISYERAMWEAYTYIQKNITGTGINFYPVYNPLRADGTASNGSTKYYDFTDQYIGHSFMNMLAGGEAVWFSADKVFFDGIKAEIVGSSTEGSGEASTPFVEDFIGFGEDYDFDFTRNLDKLVLEVNGVSYFTAKIETAQGADASYGFSKTEGGKLSFRVDYFKGNGTTEERFVWYIMESIGANDTVTLTYQLKLVKRNETIGTHVAYTNQSATLYPNGDRDFGQLFPVPEVTYTNYPDLVSDKTSNSLGNNRFEISLEVPGGDAEVEHDEVIIMVDGSYSGDDEWPSMSAAIMDIANTVLDGSGHTQLTIMAFGMGDNIVLEHITNAKALEAVLLDLPGYLLYGRSSTNCEAGFTGVANYIKNHDGKLDEVNVVYISDGEINTDETARDFSDWQTIAKNSYYKTAIKVAYCVFEWSILGNIYAEEPFSAEYPDALTKIFGDRFDGMTGNDILAAVFANGKASDAEFLAYVDAIYAEVYAYSGLECGVEYPISVVERAFVKYDKENGTFIQNAFYDAMYYSPAITYPNKTERTIAAAEALAAISNVSNLYIVDTNKYTAWMDTGVTSDKATFVQSNGIAGLCEALKETLKELSKTPYNDVVITDYMSKWVNLDPSTLKIVDVTTGQVIWTAADGWLITEGRPTAQEVPVIVELIEKDGYAAGGPDVEGNISGDIYKLTWYVKDGALLRSDNYKLVYEVTVDTAENGFEYGVDYPANGETNITYTDETPKKVTVNIKVPNVTPEVPKKTTVSFESGEASNISFMLIDKATGKVTFLKKIDIGVETSFEIPTEEGYISAVFVKQSTSGMFWTSEEIDEETQNAVIKCLKANNPSYKGHWSEFFFGDGECTWEFKSGKKVTYTFSGAGAVINKDTSDVPVVEPEIEDTPVVEDTVVDIPVVEPEVVEPTLNYTLSGGSIKNWVVVDGVTAIYVEANGKIPAVIWTSEKVDDKAMNKIVEALGADADVKISGEGKHTVEYQQNKNKTKTVTYTFKKI